MQKINGWGDTKFEWVGGNFGPIHFNEAKAEDGTCWMIEMEGLNFGEPYNIKLHKAYGENEPYIFWGDYETCEAAKAFAEKPVGAFPTTPKPGAGNMFKELGLGCPTTPKTGAGNMFKELD